MVDDCCRTAFLWDGKPKGHIGALGDNTAYITGTNKEAAVLIVPDLFGWTFNNVRLLADHFANEANCTCYVVDLYASTVIPLFSLVITIFANH